MEKDEEQKLVKSWLDAWNRHDLEGILRLYAEDIEFKSPFVEALMGYPSGTLRGKKELRAYLQKAIEGYPDLHFDLVQIFTGMDSLGLLYHSVNEKIAVEVMTVDSSGKICRVAVHYANPLDASVLTIPVT